MIVKVAPKELARYAEVAEALGIDGANDTEKLNSLIEELDKLKARVGIKPTIKEYNIDEKDFLNRLDDMTKQAFDDQCTGANPRYPLMTEIKQMYLNAYYGKTFKEPEMPNEQQLGNNDEHNIKRSFLKAKNRIYKNS